MQERQALVGPPASGKTAWLLGAWAEYGAPWGLGLAFTPEGARQLRRESQKRPDSPPLRVRTVNWLVHDLFARLGADGPRWRAIGNGGRAMVALWAWAKAAGERPAPLHRELGRAPGAGRELLRYFDLLSDSRESFSPESFSPPPTGDLAVDEVVRAYRHYLRALRRMGRAGVLEARLVALEELARHPELATELAGRVMVVDDWHLASPSEAAIVERIARGARRVIMTADFPLAKATVDDARLCWLSERLQAMQVAVVRGRLNQSSPPRVVLGRLVGEPPPPSMPAGEPVRAFLAASPSDEAEIVAQEVARFALEGGDLDDVAVVPFDRAILPHLGRALVDYRLQREADDGSLASQPLIRACLSALAVASGEDPEEGLSALLVLPPCELSARERENALGRGWRALACEEGALGRLGRALASLEEDLAFFGLAPRAEGEGSEQASAEDLAEALERFVSAAGLRQALLASSAPTTQQDRWLRQFEVWLRQVRETCRLQRDLGLRLGVASRLGLEALETATFEQIEGAVWIAMGASQGWGARLVFLTGLSEQALPAAPTSFQMLTAEQLSRLKGLAGLPNFIPPQEDVAAVALARARRRLAQAVARCSERLVMSTSATDEHGQRLLPSYFWVEALGPDGHFEAGKLKIGGGAFAPLHSQQLSPGNPPLTLSADTPPLALVPHWGRVAERVERLPAENAPAVHPPGAYHATLVDSFAACPKKTFWRYSLCIEERESDHRSLGNLVHRVLKGLCDPDPMGPCAGKWARAVEPDWKQMLAEAEELTDEALADEQSNIVFSSPLARSFARQRTRELLSLFCRFEAKVMRHRDFFQRETVAVEKQFCLRFHGFFIAGRVDRVDRLITPQGREFYEVLDYKTSRSENPSEATLVKGFLPGPGEPSRSFQLPVYYLALRAGALETPPNPPVAWVSLYYPWWVYGSPSKPPKDPEVFSSSGLRRLCFQREAGFDPYPPKGTLPYSGHSGSRAGKLLQPEEVQASEEALLARLNEMRASYEQGDLPSAPRDDEVCERCPYSLACDRGLASYAAGEEGRDSDE